MGNKISFFGVKKQVCEAGWVLFTYKTESCTAISKILIILFAGMVGNMLKLSYGKKRK